MKRKYIEAVVQHNLLKVRIMLFDELLLAPRGITYSEMLEYAMENLSNLFEAYPGAKPLPSTRCMKCGYTMSLHKPQKF